MLCQYCACANRVLWGYAQCPIASYGERRSHPVGQCHLIARFRLRFICCRNLPTAGASLAKHYGAVNTALKLVDCGAQWKRWLMWQGWPSQTWYEGWAVMELRFQTGENDFKMKVRDESEEATMRVEISIDQTFFHIFINSYENMEKWPQCSLQVCHEFTKINRMTGCSKSCQWLIRWHDCLHSLAFGNSTMKSDTTRTSLAFHATHCRSWPQTTHSSGPWPFAT